MSEECVIISVKKIALTIAIESVLVLVLSFLFTFSGQLFAADCLILFSVILVSAVLRFVNNKLGIKKSFFEYYSEVRKEIGIVFKALIALFVALIFISFVKYGLLEGQLLPYSLPSIEGTLNFLSMINVFVLFGTAVLLIAFNINLVSEINELK